MGETESGDRHSDGDRDGDRDGDSNSDIDIDIDRNSDGERDRDRNCDSDKRLIHLANDDQQTVLASRGMVKQRRVQV